MTVAEFEKLIVEQMQHQPTDQQRALIGALARFCSHDTDALSAFIINGYAGTGKTSVIGALVKALKLVRRNVVLLAPTGRAAKVLSTFAQNKAYTIHRVIYQTDIVGSRLIGIASNPFKNAIFIIDEASMIGQNDGENLLDDLIHYIYGNGEDCRAIFLGDTAQLPPVGCDRSPAMSPAILKSYGLKVSRAVMTRTVRQASASGILYNATALRMAMAQSGLPENPIPLTPPRLRVSAFDDVASVDIEDLEDDLASSYSRHGISATTLITRSNRRATQFNLAIRNNILGKEEIIERGEPLMIAKNNYHWIAKVSKGDFIANGDTAIIEAVYGFEKIGDLNFADVRLAMPDRDISFDCKIILDSLTSDTPSLTPEVENRLVEIALRDVTIDTVNDPLKRARVIKADPYYNAIRVKYAYAVTCHKAQGGQWESVFIDMAGIGAEATVTTEFYRWLYTAVTRAVDRVTFIAPTVEVK